jgi:hypothetical protein
LARPRSVRNATPCYVTPFWCCFCCSSFVVVTRRSSETSLTTSSSDTALARPRSVCNAIVAHYVTPCVLLFVVMLFIVRYIIQL